jgi:putative ABC transport system ATP-binding protein
MMALVEMQGVSKDYHLGETVVRALRGVDLVVERGEFTSIVGPSGSGKTTLLNLIGCVDTPSAGTLSVDGHEIRDADVDRLAGLRNEVVGFIFQSFNLIPVLSALENVEFPLLCGAKVPPRSERLRRARAALESVGISAFADHWPDQLSGGQRQRVAIARALVTEPHLVLADEPTANLDGETAHAILELMQKLNRENGVTFLFSTHDARVVSLARRIVRIEDGRIVNGTEPGARTAAS